MSDWDGRLRDKCVDGSILLRWMGWKKKSILTSSGETAREGLLRFILRNVQPHLLSLPPILSAWSAAPSCLSPSGQPHQSAWTWKQRVRWGGKDRVSSSKSCSPSHAVNIMSAILVRHALWFWHGNAVLCAVVYTVWHYISSTKKYRHYMDCNGLTTSAVTSSNKLAWRHTWKGRKQKRKPIEKKMWLETFKIGINDAPFRICPKHGFLS